MYNKYKDYLTLCLIGVMYIFSVIKVTLYFMHVPIKSWQMFLFALLAFLFFALIDTKAVSIAFLSLVAVSLIYFIYLLICRGLYGLIDFFSPVTKLIQVMTQIGMGYYNEAKGFAEEQIKSSEDTNYNIENYIISESNLYFNGNKQLVWNMLIDIVYTNDKGIELISSREFVIDANTKEVLLYR